jgi:hypothetical protein
MINLELIIKFMTSNDEPLKERRIYLTEENLDSNSSIPEELRNHTIKRLQKECSRKVNILLLLALFCSTGLRKGPSA